jgi:hypothetical protein
MGTLLLAETTEEDVNRVGRGRHMIVIIRLFYKVETEKLTTIYQVARI